MMRTAVSFAIAMWVLLGIGSCRPVPEKAPGELESAPDVRSWQPPEVKLTRLDSGEQEPLSAYRGRVVLLDFWATWCAPCRSEIPALNRIYHDLADEGLTVIGLAVDRASPPSLRTRVEQLRVQYPVAVADDEVQRVFGEIRVVPTKIIIDREGRVRDRFEGVLPEGELRRRLMDVLREG